MTGAFIVGGIHESTFFRGGVIRKTWDFQKTVSLRGVSGIQRGDGIHRRWYLKGRGHSL